MEVAVESIITDILSSLGVSYTAIQKNELAGQTIYSIESQSDARTLIGPHGDAIHALDMLVKRIAEKRVAAQGSDEELLFMVDVNGYRSQRIKDLQTKAMMMADRARSFQYDVELEPMSAYERLIVHTTLQDAPQVKTESQGEGRGRRVVIRYQA